MRRLAAILVCTLGIALMILGIGRMSWWAPSGVMEITLDPESTEQAPFIVLDNNIRKDLQPPVQVEIKSAGNFSVSQGDKEDALAWLGEVKRATATRIEHEKLVVEAVGSQPNAPDPAGADIWYESNIGQKQYTGRWESPENGEWDLVIASDGRAKAPVDIKLTSPQRVSFTIPILLLVFGGILFILGLLGAIFTPKRGRFGDGASHAPRAKKRNGYSARHRPSKARLPSSPRTTPSRAARPGARRRYGMTAALTLALTIGSIGCIAPVAADDKTEINGVVEGKQLQRIVDNINQVVVKSEQALDVKGLDARVGQPELSLRAANYAIRKEIRKHPALSPISGAGDEGFGIVRRYVQEDKQWPRTVSIVTQSGKDQSAQYIVMTQRDARSDYKVNQVTPIVQGQTAFGAKQLPPQAVTWLSATEKIDNLGSPKETLDAFLALLKGAGSAKDRFVANDAVFSQVDSQNKIDEGAELVRPIDNAINKAEIRAFKSVDGDLLVSGVIETTIAQRPKQGKVIKLPPPQRVLARTEEVNGTVTIRTVEPVTIMAPKDGGALQVVAFSRSYVQVKAER